MATSSLRRRMVANPPKNCTRSSSNLFQIYVVMLDVRQMPRKGLSILSSQLHRLIPSVFDRTRLKSMLMHLKFSAIIKSAPPLAAKFAAQVMCGDWFVMHRKTLDLNLCYITPCLSAFVCYIRNNW
ncbi:hypothetical protein MUK42_35118 [Musa troglodytarum]|uniref:Uncharacterized protein n=1 Tax=Musa troglodytarum TaxID=320322 RepID=A0A9E7JD05_9LILI|nr:hypothetical protein MUK42_35118 [Musa troglodytarum]